LKYIECSLEFIKEVKWPSDEKYGTLLLEHEHLQRFFSLDLHAEKKRRRKY